MTQTEAILAALHRRGEDGLTPLEALEAFGCFRLAARISDIKETLGPDEEIVNVGATINGKTVARYILRRSEAQASIW